MKNPVHLVCFYRYFRHGLFPPLITRWCQGVCGPYRLSAASESPAGVNMHAPALEVSWQPSL